MPQFDVHRNPSAKTRERTPFLLVVQSDALHRHSRRVVVPLARADQIGDVDDVLNPAVDVAGHRCVLLPTDIASVPASVLKMPVANIEDRGDAIIRALDLLFARY